LLAKDTKFGKTMVVKTSKFSGGYTLGFRIDPPDRAMKVVKRMLGLLSVFCVAPIFGVVRISGVFICSNAREFAMVPLTEVGGTCYSNLLSSRVHTF
jgi:hypothetical protein